MSRALWHQYKKIHREKKKEQERETEYLERKRAIPTRLEKKKNPHGVRQMD